MADNLTLAFGTVATRDQAGAHHQRITLGATSAAPTRASVTSSATVVTIQALNTARNILIVSNKSTATLYLKFGSAATLTDWDIELPPGAMWEMPVHGIYTGIVTGIWDSANGYARVVEM